MPPHSKIEISTMKIALLFLTALTSTTAFAPLDNNGKTVSTALRAEIGETGVGFEHVAREWRCKVRSLVLWYHS